MLVHLLFPAGLPRPQSLGLLILSQLYADFSQICISTLGLSPDSQWHIPYCPPKSPSGCLPDRALRLSMPDTELLILPQTCSFRSIPQPRGGQLPPSSGSGMVLRVILDPFFLSVHHLIEQDILLDFTFKIRPEFDHFPPLLLLPSWPKPLSPRAGISAAATDVSARLSLWALGVWSLLCSRSGPSDTQTASVTSHSAAQNSLKA